MDSFLGAATKYSRMISQISIWTAISANVLTLIVRENADWVDSALSGADYLSDASVLPEFLASMAGGNLVIVGIAFVLSRIFKLHNRLSDLMQIRKRFDLHAILLPLALMTTKSRLTNIQIKKIAERRQDLMRKVFYEYASSDPKRCAIDISYVEVALEQWTWYWVMLEATFLTLVSAVVLVLTPDSSLAAAWLFAAVLVGIGILLLMRGATERNALNEVEAIASDADRCKHIASVFDAL